MKHILFIACLFSFTFINAQAYKGKGDTKFQVGANFQDAATSINVTYDYGLGENISLGLSSAYALGIDEALDADFTQRFDLKVRLNANLGNVININENLDIYPGLNLGLKNFGGHLGARYFFSDGFGLFTEINTPFAEYKTDLTPSEMIHNQFSVSIGASFNL